jgi:hypothetical protein
MGHHPRLDGRAGGAIGCAPGRTRRPAPVRATTPNETALAYLSERVMSRRRTPQGRTLSDIASVYSSERGA